MDRWDIALLVVAAYFSGLALLRLMVRRRDQMVRDFQRQMEQQRERKKKAESQEPARPSRAA